MSAVRLEIEGLPGMPEVRAGDDLAVLVLASLTRAGQALATDDVLVVAQKVVSKAEGRVLSLSDVTPSSRARALAAEVDKDPRLVEVILGESNAVVAAAPGVLVVEHRSGHVMANAGVDRSNVGGGDEERVLLLPVDPDDSARRLREALHVLGGVAPAIVVSDSIGRPWRVGTAAVAIGAAGLPAVMDLRGGTDRDGRELLVSIVGLADQVAAAAALVMGEGAEGRPVALVRGLRFDGAEVPAAALLRERDRDLFR